MSALLFERDGATAILTLNRPGSANSVDEAMIDLWEGALGEIEADSELRAVILTGAGERSFCAGGDLEWFASITGKEEGAAMSARMSVLLDRMWRLEIPVIAAVSGAAYGGGCEVLTACHVRLASEGARFAFRQAAMGVVTGWGGAARLFRLIGAGRAMRLLLTAEPVDAAEARRIGLVDSVHPASDLLEVARETARHVAACGRDAVAGFLALARGDEPDTARRESELFAELWGEPDFVQRINRASGRDS